jgi:hypothetical protein
LLTLEREGLWRDLKAARAGVERLRGELERMRLDRDEACEGANQQAKAFNRLRAEVERLRDLVARVEGERIEQQRLTERMRPVVEAAVAMTWDEPSLRRIDEAVDAYLAAQGEDDG